MWCRLSSEWNGLHLRHRPKTHSASPIWWLSWERLQHEKGRWDEMKREGSVMSLAQIHYWMSLFRNVAYCVKLAEVKWDECHLSFSFSPHRPCRPRPACSSWQIPLLLPLSSSETNIKWQTWSTIWQTKIHQYELHWVIRIPCPVWWSVSTPLSSAQMHFLLRHSITSEFTSFRIWVHSLQNVL